MDELGDRRAAPRRAAPGAALTVQEAMSNAAVIMFGGIETTEGMILNLLRTCSTTTAAARAVVADPALAEAAVEESLRLEPAAASSTGTRPRRRARPARDRRRRPRRRVAGRRQPRPAEFADPDRFDLAPARTLAATSRSPPDRTCASAWTSPDWRRSPR